LLSQYLSLESNTRVNKIKRDPTVPVSPRCERGDNRKSTRLLKKALPKFEIFQLESIAQKASEKIKDKVDDAFNPFKPVLNIKPF